MACSQENELKTYGIFTHLFTEVENILLANRTYKLNSYEILNRLNPTLRIQITNMLNLIKARNISKGKVIRGGFYAEASFVGVVASLVEMSNTNVVRGKMLYPSLKKRLTYFCWI